jgi:phage tail-like protein
MPAQGLGPNQPADALSAARFSITIDGVEIAAFSELSGIVTEVESVAFRQSTDKEVVLSQLPGVTVMPKVVLKRGKNTSTELWAWHESVLMGDIVAARKSCSLVMYNYNGDAVARYHMENAWPSKLEIGALKAGASEVLMESVTLVCERRGWPPTRPARPARIRPTARNCAPSSRSRCRADTSTSTARCTATAPCGWPRRGTRSARRPTSGCGRTRPT